MKMLPRILFSLVIFSLTTAFGGLCVDDLNGRKPIFEFKDPRLKMEQWDRYHLGSGDLANVQLHFDKYQNKWIVVKAYKDGNSARENDIRGMSFLESIQDRHPLRIAHYKRHVSDSKLVEMEYHPGKTLEMVLADKTISDEVKAGLVFTYRKALKNIELEMYRQNFIKVEALKVSRGDGQAIEALAGNSGQFLLFLKPDNIIVDPYTLHLIVVDPH